MNKVITFQLLTYVISETKIQSIYMAEMSMHAKTGAMQKNRISGGIQKLFAG